MNEFYEAVSNLFEELRCDFGEREYTVQPEEWKEAEKNLKQIQKELPQNGGYFHRSAPLLSLPLRQKKEMLLWKHKPPPHE